jgi:hypothetical protein
MLGSFFSVDGAGVAAAGELCEGWSCANTVVTPAALTSRASDPAPHLRNVTFMVLSYLDWESV